MKNSQIKSKEELQSANTKVSCTNTWGPGAVTKFPSKLCICEKIYPAFWWMGLMCNPWEAAIASSLGVCSKILFNKHFLCRSKHRSYSVMEICERHLTSLWVSEVWASLSRTSPSEDKAESIVDTNLSDSLLRGGYLWMLGVKEV